VKLPSPPVFTVQDNPDLDPQFLGRLTTAFEDLHDTVNQVPESSDLADRPFVTPASGPASVELKNPLTGKPTHVIVSNVVRADGAALTAPWSPSWSMKSGVIVVSIVGLPASTKCLLTAKVE
jgi:hypothetical protein